MTRFAVAAALALASTVAANAQSQPVTQPLPMYEDEGGGQLVCRTLECFGREYLLKKSSEGTLRTPVKLNTRTECEKLNWEGYDHLNIHCIYSRRE